MVNKRPPWVDYRALMPGRLIGLYKYPGVWTVGVGDTCLQMLLKCVLAVTGAEVKEACGKEQLCGGL